MCITWLATGHDKFHDSKTNHSRKKTLWPRFEIFFTEMIGVRAKCLLNIIQKLKIIRFLPIIMFAKNILV